MRYRQNTKGDILYGPPVNETTHFFLIVLSCVYAESIIRNE